MFIYFKVIVKSLYRIQFAYLTLIVYYYDDANTNNHTIEKKTI